MKQFTIGLIIDELDHEYQMKTWQGIFDEAKDQGINVISFVGKRLDSPSGFEAKANIVYDLITKKRIDGVVILSAAVGSSADPVSFKQFMKRFNSIPVVSIGVELPEASSVLVDNYRGMYDAIEHLIVEHKITEIAFISGPGNNEESNIRRKAYEDALTAHNIKVDPALSICGNFTTESGAEAVNELINVRKKKIRGIGAANDYMAFGAIEALSRCGLSVPNDVAVIGFDNVETAITSIPPLTTVKQPIYLEGREAVKLLMSKMNGLTTGKSVTMLTQVEIRQSCGCFASEKISINKSEIASVDKSSKKQKNISAGIVSIDDDIKELYKQLTIDVDSRACDVFLPLFYSSMRAIADTGWNPAVLYGRISRLRKHVYAVYPDNESIYFAESLLHEARTMVGAKTEQLQILSKLNADRESSQMHFIGQRLLTSYRIEDMYEVLKQEFPRIGINSCGISFFNEKTDLCVGFSFTNKSIQNKEGTVYPLNDILPDSLWPVSPFNMVVLPLFFRNEQLGIVVLPVSPRNGEIYEIIGREISSSVKATRLYEEQSQSQEAMRAKADKIQSLISPMLETIKRISDVSLQKISLVEGLSSSTKDGVGRLELTNDVISKASGNINKMLEMTEIIDDIASNINILAINASIESAHAGEYGRGFEIIAKEVRKLSDSTAENAKVISDMLRNVVESIDKSIKASGDNFMAFRSIETQVAEVTSFLKEVLDRMNELSSGSEEILSEMMMKKER